MGRTYGVGEHGSDGTLKVGCQNQAGGIRQRARIVHGPRISNM